MSSRWITSSSTLLSSLSCKSIDKSSSREISSSRDSSSIWSISSFVSSLGVSSAFVFETFSGLLSGVTFSVLRRLKMSATTIKIKIAGNVAIKTTNHKLEKILFFSNSACCFSNSNSCSLACAFSKSSCCNLIISSICSFISFPLATSFCIMPN